MENEPKITEVNGDPQPEGEATDSYGLVTSQPPKHSRFQAAREWYLQRKRWTIPASVLLLVLVLGVIPWSRYHAAGLVLKNEMTLKVVDATANVPVSGALVSTDSVTATTDGSGLAKLRNIKVGPHHVVITKKYYQDQVTSVLVPIAKQKQIPQIRFTATGRQAQINVVDLISGKKISNASISVAGIEAKTDKNGSAVVVVPATATNEKASIKAEGYNGTEVTVEVSGDSIKQNTFKLSPSGKVYFLSKLSGNIDVIKTNLDGTERETVLAGTGKEDDTNTILLASRDWKYLALLAIRDSALPKLYVLSTSDDKLLTMDEGNADFTPIGWDNHRFVYTVSRNGYNPWQSNAFSIKSYNADTGQLLTLVNTSATGSSKSDAQYEAVYSTLLMGSDVVYTKTWYQYPGYLSVSGKQNVIAAIRTDGSNNRQIKSVDSATSYIGSVKLNKPNQLYFSVDSNDSDTSSYYSVDKSGNVSSDSALSEKSFFSETKTYLASPSGDKTFWSEQRDGKNSLFVGDQDGNNGKQLASLSDYEVYGWYTDDYLLVSKNSSELYIIPVAGLEKDSQAIKVSDYHKPSYDFYGYGGGYGGL